MDAHLVEDLLLKCLEHPAEERAAVCEAICASHPELAAELRARLAWIEETELVDDAATTLRPSDLLLRCLAGPEPEWQRSIEEACTRHPQHAASLRQLFLAIDELPRLAGDAQLASGQAPDRIAGFRLIRELGRGGMGVVYLAEQQRGLRRLVALKLIKRGMDTEAILRRFEVERQALARMAHPNVARVHEAGMTEDGRPYAVMEYVAGHTLTVHCDRGRLDTTARLRLFLAVCAGVQHAHDKGVLHRDLKPSNILVTLEDGRALPKVIDFGLARALDQRLTEDSLLTVHGQMVGTPEYMSPEQIELPSFALDVRADVYSLGVTLYELLTGCLPFDSQRLRTAGMAEIQRLIRDNPPSTPSTRTTQLDAAAAPLAACRGTKPRELARLLRGDLDSIVMRAIHMERSERYPSVRELAEDIELHLTQQPIRARPASVALRTRKWLRRRRAGIGVAAGVFAAFAIGLAVSLEPRAGGGPGTGPEPLEEAARVRLEANERTHAELVERIEGTDLLANGTRLELEEWLKKARGLAATLPEHRAKLDALWRDASPASTPDATWDGPYELLPVDARGRPLSGGVAPMLSDDGRFVAFESRAAISADDTNGVLDIYVLDRTTGRTRRVSQTTAGTQSPYNSHWVSISANGRFVAYAADGLHTSVLVHDSLTGKTWCASGDDDASQRTCSHRPCLSADGRTLVFESDAALAADDGNRSFDIYCHDVAQKTTVRITKSVSGGDADGRSQLPWTSGDGRLIAYESTATNLVAGDGNGKSDVFVHDRASRRTDRISIGIGGTEADGGSYEPTLSVDGRFVAFRSDASNLVAGDTNGQSDIFVCELATGSIERVSVASDGTQSDGYSHQGVLSRDGRFVVFDSKARTLAAVPKQRVQEAFLHDRKTRRTLCVSASPSRAYGGGSGAYRPVISADGTCVAFDVGQGSVLVLDLIGLDDESVRLVSRGIDGKTADAGCSVRQISPDGRSVVLHSHASNLVAGDTNGRRDVFVCDTHGGGIVRASLGQDGQEGNGDSGDGRLTDDGRLIVFTSHADNLVPDDTNGVEDIFLRDLVRGTTERLPAAAVEPNGRSSYPRISADGRIVVFTSQATNLLAEDRQTIEDLLVWQRETGSLRLLTPESGTRFHGKSWEPELAANGRRVAFSSEAMLVATDTDRHADAYVADLDGGITRCSVPAGRAGNPGPSFAHNLSDDGSRLTFTQHEGRLVVADTNDCWDVYVFDLARNQHILASVDSLGRVGNGNSEWSRLSRTGRWVAFRSLATNLVPDDQNRAWDVFLRDLDRGRTLRVSVDALGREVDTAGWIDEIRLTADGEIVCFDTESAEIVSKPGRFEHRQVVLRHTRDLVERDRRRAARDALPRLDAKPDTQRELDARIRLVGGIERLQAPGDGSMEQVRRRLAERR